MDDAPEKLIILSEARALTGLPDKDLLARARAGGVRVYGRHGAVYLGRASFMAWMRREGIALPKPVRRGFLNSAEAARRLDIPEDILVRLASMDALRMRVDRSSGHLLFSEAGIAAALDVERGGTGSPDSQRRAMVARIAGGLSGDAVLKELEDAAGHFLDVHHAWWLSFLLTDPWPGAEPMTKQDLFVTYYEFCARVGKPRDLGQIGLGKFVRNVCGPTLRSMQREVVQRTEHGDVTARPYFFVFPPLVVLRERWDEYAGRFPWLGTS
jgi:hypothetical protein